MVAHVINAPAVRDFLETGAAHLDGAARDWARRHAWRFLLRDERCFRRRPPGGGSGPGEAAQLERARRLDRDPVWFVPDPSVREELSLVLDWIGALDEIDPRLARKRDRISYEHARDHARRWHDRLAARDDDGVADDPAGVEAVFDLGGGWRWVRLRSAAALDYEGRRMRHCVGDGAYDRLRTDIYSLRDPDNMPCCTVEFDTQRARVQQAKARGNSDVPAKYMDRVEVLLRHLGPRRLNSRLTEFAVTENGDIYRLSRAPDWPEGTRILNHLVLSNRYDVARLPDGLYVNGSLIVANCALETLPRDMTVCQALAGLSLSPVRALPEGLTVRVLNLEDSLVKEIAPGTRVLKELSLLNSPVRALPEGVSVGRLLILDGGAVRRLPPDLRVNGTLAADWVRGELPETVVVMGDASFAELMFDGLDSMTVYGRLSCAGWPNTLLPEELTVYGDFEFANVEISPESLRSRLCVHGTLDIRGSGLARLPEAWTVHGKVLND
jgi:hypothetical protein